MTGRVIIGGGRGFIGTHLTRLLQGSGYKVMHISRNPGVNTLTWNDITSRGLPECTAVVNLAGKLVMQPFRKLDERLKSELRSSRLETNDLIVRAIKESSHPPKVFVASSSIGGYRPSETAEYTEECPIDKPFDFFTELVKDWEASSELPKGCPTRLTTVRIGLALGRDGGVVLNMFLPFYFGVGGNISTGKQWFPWIHVDDVAGIIKFAIENEHVGGVLNAVAPPSNTNAEFTKAFGRALWRPTIFPLPAFVINMVFGKELAKIMLEGQNVFPKRTVELGYKFLYPDLDSACKEFAHLIIQTESLKL